MITLQSEVWREYTRLDACRREHSSQTLNLGPTMFPALTSVRGQLRLAEQLLEETKGKIVEQEEKIREIREKERLKRREEEKYHVG